MGVGGRLAVPAFPLVSTRVGQALPLHVAKQITGESTMKYGLNIRPEGALDLLSLGALVHRLDPGMIPFRKATECKIHVSGGEFNCAANLSDCFGLQTGIATAKVDYPIGDLIAERVRAMGVKPFYTRFKHNGVNGPNMATVYSD